MSNNRLYSIYRLFDKRDPDITRYVGYTANVEARFSQHVTGEGINLKKDAWVRALGDNLGIEVIEEGWMNLQNVKVREAYWIGSYLLEGYPLLNASIPVLSKQMCSYDFDEYCYYQVEIPLNSDAYRLLMEDVRQSGMSKDISSLLAIRVADYYAGHRSAVIVDAIEKPTVKSDATTAKSNAEALLDTWE